MGQIMGSHSGKPRGAGQRNKEATGILGGVLRNKNSETRNNVT